MTGLRRLVSRIREFLFAGAVERDLTEEVRSHIDHATDEYVRRGFTRDEARRRARRDLGGAGSEDVTRESIRDARGLPFLEQVAIDARRAIRSLAKTRGFTTVAILTLSLGVGVSTAVFSLLDHVLLRPLPYDEPDRLVSIWEARVGGTGVSAPPASLLTGNDDPNRLTVAPAAYLDFKARAAGFSAMAGYDRDSRTLTGAGEPAQIPGEIVTSSYFAVLGATAMRGRLLGPIDEQAASASVAVISHALWQRRFNGDEAIVGKTITLNKQPLEIVGVMAPGFVPASQFVQIEPISYWVTEAFRPDLLTNYGDHEIAVVARLSPGVTVADVRRNLTAISEDIERRSPKTNTGMRAFVRPFGDDIVRRVRTSLTMISLMVVFILIIVCVNTANLLIVRGAGRRREIAIRYALGASRRRVLSEMLTESLVLALSACAGGVAIAYWLKNVLVSLAPPSLPRLGNVALDGRVLLFGVSLSLLTGLVFGALPAWQSRRAKPLDAISSGGRVVASGWMMRWRNALMVFEIAVSTVLLIGAGLMVKSLLTLNGVELGFRTDGVLAINVALPEHRYATADSRYEFFRTLETRVRQIPEVAAVGYANRFPMRGAWGSGFMIEGHGNDMVAADFQAVSTGYFETIDVRLVRGRLLNERDVKTSEAVAVVSEAFGRKLLDGADARGTRFRRGQNMPWITIVGVVADIRRDGKRAEINPQVFLPAAQTLSYPVRLADLAVRVQGDSGTASRLAPALRAAVADVDPDQPVSNVRTLEEVVVLGAREQRFQAVLLGLFALLALFLATIGVHGVVAYLVAQRTPEIGVRMALGAGPLRILRWLLTATTWHVTAGAAAGLLAAVALSRYVKSLLFQVTPLDAATYAFSTALLCAVALAAAALAAWRATAIDPVKALRAE